MRQVRSGMRLYGVGFFFRLSLLLALWIWFISVARQYLSALAKNALYDGFDPYGILGVNASTKAADLNRAFRREAFKHHPDKTSDPKAVEKFLLVRKAFDSLTDPESMSNFKQFGNPDGPQYVQLFAISSFIKDKDASRANGYMTYKKQMFRAADLQAYLLGIVFAILGIIFVWEVPMPGAGEEEDIQCSMHGGTRTAFSRGLHSVSDASAAATLLLKHAQSSPWCRVRSGVQDWEPLVGELPQGLFGKATTKAEALFFAHIHRRHASLTKPLRHHLDELLARWHALARAMAGLAASAATSKALVAAVELQRCLVQALDPGSAGSPVAQLLQAPHLDEQMAGAWHQSRRGRGGLRGFLEQSPAERRAGLPGLEKRALADVEEFASVAPRLEVARAVVAADGGGELREGGTARLQVTLRRQSLAPGEAAGAAHAPLFPGAAVPEAWWLLLELGDEPEALVACKRLADRGREVQAELPFTVPARAKCSGRLIVMCEAYAGLDVERQISFTAKPVG